MPSADLGCHHRIGSRSLPLSRRQHLRRHEGHEGPASEVRPARRPARLREDGLLGAHEVGEFFFEPVLLAAGLGWSGLSLQQALLGAVLGYLSLWSVGTLFRRVTGEEGMGEGDFKLLAALGAWSGPLLLIPLVLLASLLGLIAGLLLRSRGQLREGRYIPFGPFLAAAAVALRLGLDRPILSAWGVS